MSGQAYTLELVWTLRKREKSFATIDNWIAIPQSSIL